MNFWVKIMKDDKIVRDAVERNERPLTPEDAELTLQEVCERLDLPTPILTRSHYKNLETFNFIKFKPSDFVESVDMDYLQVEMFYEQSKKTEY